jgi:ApaG protein
MFEATTRGISVTVEPEYCTDRSNPEDSAYFWLYTITIRNTGSETVKLLTRHWEITDARGRTETVDGRGVVGEQPVLPPDGAFRYTSGAPLSTPSGFMRGTYGMADETGRGFEVMIPAFSLDSPLAPTTLN